MKQSILFEQGKLYVVELPEKNAAAYVLAYALATANKVKVKNSEFVTSTYFGFVKLEYGKELKYGDTFPLPDNLEVVKNDCSDTATCKCKIVCKKPTVSLVLKRIEPEKPEETQEELWGAFMRYIFLRTPVFQLKEMFTIQRKKS